MRGGSKNSHDVFVNLNGALEIAVRSKKPKAVALAKSIFGSELVLFQDVSAGAIETLFDDQNQPWFKRAHVGKFLEITDIKASTRSEELREEMRERFVISTGWITPPWSGPKDQQDKTDIFLSVYGFMRVTVGSKKEKGKALKDYILKDIIPRGLNQKLRELQEEHQRTITERDNVIEEKDAAIALLHDDLEDVGKQLVDLEHENCELQNEVERLQERYVPYLQDTRKDNGMVVIQKNNGDEYGYVAICGQQGYVTQKIKNKLIDYPNGNIVVLAETPNAIVHYNFLREQGCIIANPERVRHFKLGQHYTHKQLMELQEVQVL